MLEEERVEIPTFRTVHINDTEQNIRILNLEPKRLGPPVTGPGEIENLVITSQYTTFNFIPKNLYKQFHRPANCYFLFISCLQTISEVSITNGVPTTLFPLIFVLAVTALKDALEDFQRHKADDQENNRQVLRITHPNEQPETVTWQELHIGDIIEVRNRETIPADIVLLSSSDINRLCFVMTANLDGETNLKPRQVHSDIADDTFEGTISCDLPNNKLEMFEGTLFTKNGKMISLTHKNILLRGCQLRNTDWVRGAIIYAGHETKIQMNAAETPFKASTLRQFTDKQTLFVFLVQVACCFVGAVLGGYYISTKFVRSSDYLWGNGSAPNPAHEGFLKFWTFFIIFTNFIPISLLVTLDMVKFFQAKMMMWDLSMYHETTLFDSKVQEMPMLVRSSDLNEELGMVDHIFSDKTGTLTCNRMEFRKCAIAGQDYGIGTTEIGKAVLMRQGKPIPQEPIPNINDPVTPNVNFIDPSLTHVLKTPSHPDHFAAHEFFTHLALNHDVMLEHVKKETIYSPSNPDEGALVYAAKHFGFYFHHRDPKHFTIQMPDGSDHVFDILHTLEFSSDRKRSSVIVKRIDGSIVLYCKGADNVIESRLDPERNDQNEVFRAHECLKQFVDDGLRTLLVAKVELDKQKYEQWAKLYHEAEISFENREEKKQKLMSDIEQNLILQGATAIEDKLQDGVSDTLACLRQAGIKIWMLTGDKVGTAINIGFSCSLLTTEMEIFRITAEDGNMIESVRERERERKKTSRKYFHFTILILN